MLSFSKDWSKVNCFYLFNKLFSTLFFEQPSGYNTFSIHLLLQYTYVILRVKS